MKTCPRPGCGRRLHSDGTCWTHGTPPEQLTAPLEELIQPEDEKKKAAPKWTKAEERFALANNGKMTGRQMGKMLGRPYKGVKAWFRRNGLHLLPVAGQERKHWGRLPCPGAGKPWTEDEEAAIEDGELGILGRARTKKAIANKASNMGIPIRSGDGALSVHQVAKQYQVRRHTVQSWVKNKLLPAKRSGDVWRIDPEVARRVVPELRQRARASNGVHGWWLAPDTQEWIEGVKREMRREQDKIDKMLQFG